jgi:hypothetical protein
MKKTKMLIALSIVAAAVSCQKEKPLPTGPSGINDLPVLRSAGGSLSAPVAEARFYKLFPSYTHTDDFEGSGVKVQGSYFYAVFDNRLKIGKIKNTLPINSSQNTLVSSGSGTSNFEGITYDNYGTANYYVVDENEAHNGAYSPKIYEYDANMNLQSTAWAPYSFSSSLSTKGFEGLVWLRRGSNDYLLGLCEGSGTIVVMMQNGSNWDYVTSFSMPAGTGMTDFSDIDISSGYFAGIFQNMDRTVEQYQLGFYRCGHHLYFSFG